MICNLMLIILTVLVNDTLSRVKWEHLRCSSDKEQSVPEGKVEDIGRFPWFGVVQHSFYLGGKTRFAVTSGVLVHPEYAIASAEDISRIPIEAVANNTKFIVWQSASIKFSIDIETYYLSPEYLEGQTLASIALVQLYGQGGAGTIAPVLPVCLPLAGGGTFNDMYAVKMNDDTGEIQKEVFKMEYVENQDCEEFYYKNKLNYKKMTPVRSLCAAGSGEQTCVWDAGVALVSRQTWGYWRLIFYDVTAQFYDTKPGTWARSINVLHQQNYNANFDFQLMSGTSVNSRELGFSVRGPGCNAPARFLPIQDHLFWIDEAITRAPMEEKKKDEMLIFRRVSPIKIIMYKAQIRQPKDLGQCDRKTRGHVMFKDTAEILVSKNFAQGFYFMSLAQVVEITCATIQMEVSSRTNAAIWIEHHCHQDLRGDRLGRHFRNDDYRECFVYFKSEAYVEFRFYFSFKALIELSLFGHEEIPKFIPNPYVAQENTYNWRPTYDNLRTKWYVPYYTWWWTM